MRLSLLSPILGLIVGLLSPALVLADTISWKAAVNGNWNDPTKWDKGKVPGVGDDAFITFDGTYTVTFDAAAEVQSLTLGGTTGTQTLSNTSQSLTLDGAGTINANGVYSQSAGTLAGPGTLTVQGTLNWSGGTMSGPGVTTIAATGDLNLNGSMTMNRSFNNAGMTTWSAGNVSHGDSAVFTNQSGGTTEIKNNTASWFFNSTGNPTQFVNQMGGTVTKSTTSGTTTFSAVPFNNSGTVNVNTGVLTMNGGGASNAPFNVAAGARVDVNNGSYTLNAGSGQTGAGILRINGGTLTVAASMSANDVEVMGGTLTGVGNLTITSTCDWSGGTMDGGMALTTIAIGAMLNLSGGVVMNRSINNAGTTTWSSGNVSHGNGAVFTNQNGGNVEIKSNTASWFYNSAGNPSSFVNQMGGTVTKSTTSGTTTFSTVPFNNMGAVNANTGVLTLNGGGASNTPFNVAAGARVDVNNGSYTLNAGSGQTGAGILRINGGTLAVAASMSANDVEVMGGTLTGVGNLTITSTCDWSGGTMDGGMALTTIAIGAMLNLSGGVVMNRSINNAGTTTWSSGNVSHGNGAVFTNQNSGNVEIKSNTASWFYNSAGNPSSFVNQMGGTVTKSTTSGTTTFSTVPFNNMGAVNVNTGVLTLNGGGASSTPFNVAAGARADVNSGSYTLNAGSGQTGAGILRVNGGTLTVAANMSANDVELMGGTLTGVGNLTIAGTCDWSGGTMNGGMALTTIAMGAMLNLSGGVVMNRSINNAGTTTWSSGNVSHGNGAVFTNQSGGSVEIKSNTASWFFNSTGNPTDFVNQVGGTVTKSTTSGVTTFSTVPFDNSGSVNVNTGVLTLNGGGASNMPFNVMAGARVDVNSGNYTLNAGSGQTGAGILRINGGTLTVAASMSANDVEVMGGTLTGVGNLTITGTCDWTGGTMNGGTALTTIAAGAALNFSTGVTMNRSINNAGTATWPSGNVSHGNGAVFTNQNGGTLAIKSDASWFFNSTGNPTQFVNQVGGTVTKSTTSGTTTFSTVPFNNAGTLNATTGTLTFNSPFTQTAGATHLAGGNLATSTTIDIQGGILDGTGSVTGNVSNGGQVNPGTSPGTITVNGGGKKYTQMAQGALNIELNGLAPGTQFDQIILTGGAGVVLAGTLNVSLGFTPTAGSSFTIIDNDASDAVTGTFTGLAEGAAFMANGTQFQITYAGGTGNDVVLTFAGGAPITSTPTATNTPTVAATLTATLTPAPTLTPTPTLALTGTPTASPTPTSVLTNTPSPTATASRTSTATPSVTPTGALTPTSTSTGAPTATPTPTGTTTSTSTRTATATPSPTHSPTVTGTASAVPTATASITTTSTPTVTATSTATVSQTATSTVTATGTGTPVQVFLTGLVLSPGIGGFPGSHGQIPLGGVPVSLFLCEVRKPCLAMGNDPVASVVTDSSGRFGILVAKNLLENKLPVVAARISPTVLLRTPVLVLPATARQINADDILVDVISESAVRLLEEVGFENFNAVGLGAVVAAVKAANDDSNFETLGVEAAVDLALTTAVADPQVQMALADNQFTPTPTVTRTPVGACVGDCNGRGEVTVDEIIKGVNIALGNATLDTCPQFDADASGDVTITELIIAVNNALNGCPR